MHHGNADELLVTWREKQEQLKQLVTTRDEVDFTLQDPATGQGNTLRLVGGVDISFAAHDALCGSTEFGVAILVVLTFPELAVCYEDYEPLDLHIPYVPGFLGFRECPAYMRLIERLKATRPELLPQVLFVDGCGVLHPARCGSASMLGVMSSLPCVGVAKKLMQVEGLTRDKVQEQLQVMQQQQQTGDMVLPLLAPSGEELGAALCVAGSVRPIYVSIGHRLCLPTSVQLVRSCSLHRIPEPVRQADLRSRDWIRKKGLQGKPAPC